MEQTHIRGVGAGGGEKEAVAPPPVTLFKEGGGIAPPILTMKFLACFKFNLLILKIQISKFSCYNNTLNWIF